MRVQLAVIAAQVIAILFFTLWPEPEPPVYTDFDSSDVAIAIDKVQFDSPRIVMVHITNANNNESVFYKTVNIRHISGVEADPEGIFTVDATDFGFDIQDIAKGTYRMKVKVFLQNGDVKSKDEILNW